MFVSESLGGGSLSQEETQASAWSLQATFTGSGCSSARGRRASRHPQRRKCAGRLGQRADRKTSGRCRASNLRPSVRVC